MIWLRHELWEHQDGLSYRLASRAETDRLAAAHPEGVLKQVFYAPSTAAAVAQFYALRNLGPYLPGPDVSEDGFTLAQLESQLADFPEDTILSGQSALRQVSDAHPSEPGSLSGSASPEGHDADDHPAVAHDPEPVDQSQPADDHIEPAEPPEHTSAEALELAAPTPVHQIAGSVPDNHPSVEPLSLATPTAPPAPHDPLDLWPVAPEEAPAPRWARRKRKPNVFLGILRVLVLLIVLAAVVVGVGVATGTLDGPALLDKAKDLPILRTLLP